MPNKDKPTRVGRRDVETCLSLGLTTDSSPERNQAAELIGGGAEGTISREAEASEVEQQHRARLRLTTIAGAFTNRRASSRIAALKDVSPAEQIGRAPVKVTTGADPSPPAKRRLLAPRPPSPRGASFVRPDIDSVRNLDRASGAPVQASTASGRLKIRRSFEINRKP
jgi:hypothetical protein